MSQSPTSVAPSRERGEAGLSSNDALAGLQPRLEGDNIGVRDASAPFESLFSELFRNHVERLTRILDRLSGEPDLAADVVQESFVRLYNRGSLPDAPEAWLISVALNLLRNALNAVDSAGEIDVETRRGPRNGRPSIIITVEDNGPGIPAHVLPDIFDAFVTTRLDARGTGLGLTVSEGIITQHGGTISASNRRQGGACLEVCLPAS